MVEATAEGQCGDEVAAAIDWIYVLSVLVIARNGSSASANWHGRPLGKKRPQKDEHERKVTWAKSPQVQVVLNQAGARYFRTFYWQFARTAITVCMYRLKSGHTYFYYTIRQNLRKESLKQI